MAATLAFLAAPQAATSVVGPVVPQTVAAPAGAAAAVAEAGVVSRSSSALCTGLTLAFVGAAAAGRMKKRGRAARSAAFDPTGAVGVLAPTGYWDPCGLMKERVGADGCQWKDEETFKHYRTAELKHGRVAMMAAVGMLTTTVCKFPGFGDVPDGLAALENSVGGSGFGVVFIMAAYFEITNPAGDYNIPGPWAIDDEMKTKELANGRLAMAAVITLWLYEYGDNVLPSEQISTMLSANVLSGLGFAAAWAALVAGFAWTQPQASSEIDWSYKNFLYTKGLGPKPQALVPVPVTISAKVPAAQLQPVEAMA